MADPQDTNTLANVIVDQAPIDAQHDTSEKPVKRGSRRALLIDPAFRKQVAERVAAARGAKSHRHKKNR